MIPIVFAANVVVLVAGVALGFIRGRTYTIFIGALLVLQVSSLLLLAEDWELYGESVVLYGQALVLLGNVLLISLIVGAERLDLAGSTANRQPLQLEPRLAPRYLLLVVTMLAVVYAIRFRNGVSAGFATWQEARPTTGALDAIANVLMFYVVPSPLVLWWSRQRVAAVVLAPVILVYLQLAGSRALTLTIPALILLRIMRQPGPASRKVGKAVLLSVAAVAAFASFRIVRNVSISDLGVGLRAVASSGNDISGGESRMMGSFYFVIAEGRDGHPYGSGTTPQRLATIYLPSDGRASPKPEDITYSIWNDYLDEGYLDRYPYYDVVRSWADSENPGSDHPTVWGDGYANFGAAGVALYAFVLGGSLVALDLFSERLSSAASAIILPVAGVTLQFLARGNVVIAVGYLAYGLPAVIVLMHVFGLPILRTRPRRSMTDPLRANRAATLPA